MHTSGAYFFYSSAQDGGEISVRYLDVIGIARRLASMLGRCNNDDHKLGVSMLDRLPHAAHLAAVSEQFVSEITPIGRVDRLVGDEDGVDIFHE